MNIFDESEYPREYAAENPRVTSRAIKDPIHDYITVSATLSRFIDTKQFQRLRNVKQLGTTAYVWPGATHTRFEHSLGVAHLARIMATHIKDSQPELEVTDRDVDCVELAGLCHDLGHGPWSHVWDGSFIPTALAGTGKSWKHEDGSEMMLDYLVSDNNIKIAHEDQEFIKALISGDRSRAPHEKGFLFDIVANKRNGIDVDKLDYFHRDSHMIGDPIHLSLKRFLKSARVINDEICYAIKDANSVYEIGQTRFKLHKLIYNHKTAVAIECMLIDALLAAEPALHIAEDVFKPERFLHLTDHIMSRIEASVEPELAESRAIMDRIHARDLYICVDHKTIDWPFRELFRKHVTREHIVEAVHGSSQYPILGEDGQVVVLPNAASLTVSDVIVSFSTLHCGMKEKNVLDFVKFYSKRKPNESMKASRGEYSNLMPQYFAEVLLRIYTKKPGLFGLIQAGYRAILAKMQALDESAELGTATAAIAGAGASAVTPGTTTTTTTVPTPPATEAPSTPPPAHSRQGSMTLVPGGGGSGAATPFSNNSFTTVEPTFVPPSPTRATRRVSGGKRQLPVEEGGGAGASDGAHKRRRSGGVEWV